MPTYIYEFDETGETIEIDHGINEKHRQYLLHPEINKLMKVHLIIPKGISVVFKGKDWTKPNSAIASSDVKFPKNIKINENEIKNVNFKRTVKKANNSSQKKIRETKRFTNWLKNGGIKKIDSVSKKIK